MGLSDIAKLYALSLQPINSPEELVSPPKNAKTKDTELNATNNICKPFTSNEGKLNMIMKSGDDLQKQVTTLECFLELEALIVVCWLYQHPNLSRNGGCDAKFK